MSSTIKRVMVWLSMYPTDQQTSIWRKVAHVIVTILLFTINFTGFVANCTYFWKYLLIDIEGSLLAIMLACGIGGLVYSYAILIIMQHRMYAMYEKLSSIYDASKCLIHCYSNQLNISKTLSILMFDFSKN